VLAITAGRHESKQEGERNWKVAAWDRSYERRVALPRCGRVKSVVVDEKNVLHTPTKHLQTKTILPTLLTHGRRMTGSKITSFQSINLTTYRLVQQVLQPLDQVAMTIVTFVVLCTVSHITTLQCAKNCHLSILRSNLCTFSTSLKSPSSIQRHQNCFENYTA